MALEKREQVFVSSTYVDLVEERQEVIQTLLEADCIPSGMELFPASDDDRWTLIKRVIDDSDYYIVLVGGRYGSVDPSQGLSFTEMEFDYAVSQKKPVMGFLHSEPGKIVAEKTELSPESRAKLEAFREKVEGRMVKYWSTAQELGGQVAKSLIQIRKTHPAEGWVRARDAITPEIEQELLVLRARVSELVAEIGAREQGFAGTLEDLAQGLDEYVLPIRLQYYPRNVGPYDRHPGNAKTLNLSATVTWDDIFGAVAPAMMDEATESDLRANLNTLARSSIPAGTALPDDYGTLYQVTTGKQVLDDVKVQLFTLGLMERSERRRGVGDKNSYWRLSAHGQDQLMRRRAIRRPGPSAVADEQRGTVVLDTGGSVEATEA